MSLPPSTVSAFDLVYIALYHLLQYTKTSSITSNSTIHQRTSVTLSLDQVWNGLCLYIGHTWATVQHIPYPLHEAISEFLRIIPQNWTHPSINVQPHYYITASEICTHLLLAHLDEVLITASVRETSDVEVGAAQLASHAPCPHHCPSSKVSLWKTL